jgi:phthalate 4,5-dioxygenase reductase subunit
MAGADIPLFSLRVREVTALAEGIQGFTLARDDDATLPPFTAGAHLPVKAPNGLMRRYSLCNDPAETDRYCIAVKREADGGGGSRSLVDDTKPGDTLEVSAPRNDFALAAAPSYVLIAGGIGITPILSMARHLVSTGGAPFRLYYLGRSPEVMAFRDVLSGSEFRGRVVMHCDGGDPDRTFDLWPVLERPKGAHVYCCGPRGLMQAVRDMTGHWSSAAVHFEDFGAGNAAQPEDTAFQVRLARTGTTVDVPVGCSILEALRGHGVDIASSCESGSCGTCEVRLLEGEADHRDLVLAEHEKSRLIMVCVSRARSAELVLDL